MHSYHIAQILALIKNPLRSKSMKMILTIIATFFFSTTLVQDLFYQPSRISTSTLLNNKWLPSSLSRYSIVSTSIPPQLQTHLDENDLDLKMDPIGVHFLEYNNDLSSTPSNDFHFDAIHFNHGFGASSLSWLPAIPSLVNKLGGKIGIAHDAPGFGFTDRPSATGRKGGLVPFSSSGSAALGNALLSSRLSKENDAEGETNGQRIALFGHSMGCASTLKMALALDADVEKIVVLVAPALVGEFPDRRKKRKKEAATEENAATRSSRTIESSKLFLVRRWVSLLLAALRRVFLDPFIMYVLRRVVGRKGFWTKALRQIVWINPHKVTEADSLRFQWPAIGLGWEKGLLAFSRSRIGSSCPYDGGEIQLLQDVLDMRSTKVIIVHGTSDPIVPCSMSRKIVNEFGDRITFLEMEGEGHDPFEENVDAFVEIVTAKIQ